MGITEGTASGAQGDGAVRCIRQQRASVGNCIRPRGLHLPTGLKEGLGGWDMLRCALGNSHFGSLSDGWTEGGRWSLG